MKNIHAIIVEDEELAIQNLKKKLEINCPDVKIIASCMSAEEAIREIPKLKPQLVFLDIQLGGLNGFDVLHRLSHINFEVIFITSMKEYAVQAFRLDALDYLEKPIDEDELVDAINKVRKKLENQSHDHARISVPIQHGARFIAVDEILYCEADNNRTIFHLFSREKIRAARVLKAVEEQLSKFNFLRIHRKYLINEYYLEEFNRTDGGFVLMSNKDRLPVARTNYKLFSSSSS